MEGAAGVRGEVFLLLPQVLLEGRASEGYFNSEGLGLTTIDFMVEQVLIAGGVLSRMILPIRGRSPTYGTISKQTSRVLIAMPLPFLENLVLATIKAKPLFGADGKGFKTFTFLSQLGWYSPTCQNQPCFFSCHSNLPDLFCFLTYTIMDLEGTRRCGFGERIVCKPQGGMREKPQPPTISLCKEVMTACQ